MVHIRITVTWIRPNHWILDRQLFAAFTFIASTAGKEYLRYWECFFLNISIAHTGIYLNLPYKIIDLQIWANIFSLGYIKKNKSLAIRGVRIQKLQVSKMNNFTVTYCAISAVTLFSFFSRPNVRSLVYPVINGVNFFIENRNLIILSFYDKDMSIFKFIFFETSKYLILFILLHRRTVWSVRHQTGRH